MRKDRNSLLEAKIQKPLISSEFILRERLTERINACGKRLILLHATVGYGKTVLLTQYAQNAGEDCVWYHLSDMDNDSVVFMQYINAAVKKNVPEFEFDSQEYALLLQETDAMETAAYDFIDRLSAVVGVTGRTIVLILDDFQVITDENIQRILQLILEHTGDRLRIVIATKGSLPAFCYRYLLQGVADIISQNELSLSQNEVLTLLNAFGGDRDVSSLAAPIWQKTAGWPAGVMFACLFLQQRRQGPFGAEAILAGQKSAIDTYFMYELFQKLPSDIQTFLVKTSSLEFLNTELCNAILDRQDSGRILHCMECENLFISKIGQSERLFRYQALFKDFLKTMLTQEVEQEILTKAAGFNLNTLEKARDVACGCLMESAWEDAFSSGAEVSLTQDLRQDGREAEYAVQNEEIVKDTRENQMDERFQRQDKIHYIDKLLRQGNETKAGVMVKVACFGDFRVWLPGMEEEIKWRTKKARELFSYLYHLQGQPVDKDTILIQLWPETDKKNATSLLHTALYSIRKALTAFDLEDLIVYDKKKYAIRTELIHSDLAEVNRLCLALRKNDEAYIFNCKEILSCYRGEYLSGISCEFAVAPRAYYEQKFLQLSYIAARQSMERERWEEAVTILESAINVNPYEESLYQLILECFQAIKDVRRAKRYYTLLTDTLREDLDVKPSPEIVAAYRFCLSANSGRKAASGL